MVVERPEVATDLPIMLNSSFSDLEHISVIERRLTPLEQFTRRALSFSSVWSGRMDPDELVWTVRAILAPYTTDGMIREVIESEVLLGFRSRH
jgi:hypothetical protein